SRSPPSCSSASSSRPRCKARETSVSGYTPMTLAAVLPHINAALNAISTVLLIVAYGLIRSGRRTAHRKVMLAALTVSAVFLVTYLTYHFTAPVFVFPG